ncbi:hypothetical protein PHET_00849 [Paragonimus heterotremus]|uniref:Uncharacterized protein n=1 Tax=Paragonimus heterotremus TaxID=100268 RepID=A0A8J4WKP7_9TREM|nr:hypothetical protein PHET_00849 [Paragonimus heterotremus]
MGVRQLLGSIVGDVQPEINQIPDYSSVFHICFSQLSFESPNQSLPAVRSPFAMSSNQLLSTLRNESGEIRTQSVGDLKTDEQVSVATDHSDKKPEHDQELRQNRSIDNDQIPAHNTPGRKGRPERDFHADEMSTEENLYATGVGNNDAEQQNRSEDQLDEAVLDGKQPGTIPDQLIRTPVVSDDTRGSFIENSGDGLNDKKIETIEGLKGRSGPKGSVPIVECAMPEFVSGVQGPPGDCIPTCPSQAGPKGPKGERGDPGDGELKLSVGLLKTVVESIDRNLQIRSNRFIRRKRGTIKIRQHTNWRIQRRKQELKRKTLTTLNLLNQDPTRSNIPKQRILGVIILRNLEELKTRGFRMPVGAIIASYLENTVHNSTNGLRAMGLFVKTEHHNNQWNRIPVTFEKEITIGIPPLVLAFYPYAVNGGEFFGWYGADALCREAAEQRLGISGFRVFLADQNLPLERILPWRLSRIPVINLAVRLSYKNCSGLELVESTPVITGPLTERNNWDSSGPWMPSAELYEHPTLSVTAQTICCVTNSCQDLLHVYSFPDFIQLVGTIDTFQTYNFIHATLFCDTIPLSTRRSFDNT